MQPGLFWIRCADNASRVSNVVLMLLEFSQKPLTNIWAVRLYFALDVYKKPKILERNQKTIQNHIDLLCEIIAQEVTDRCVVFLFHSFKFRVDYTFETLFEK